MLAGTPRGHLACVSMLSSSRSGRVYLDCMRQLPHCHHAVLLALQVYSREHLSGMLLQGLQHCQATLVGDEGTGAGARGISGGERKRLTVGAGLVTQPAVLLLDEPTSGLDSETAVAIVEILQGLARQVRCALCCLQS